MLPVLSAKAVAKKLNNGQHELEYVVVEFYSYYHVEFGRKVCADGCLKVLIVSYYIVLE